MGSIVEDVRIAFRTLLKERGFTAITVLTLAVAIGANTAIFSVVDSVQLRPLPYPDADRVVTVAAATLPEPGRTGELPFSPRGYWHFVDNNRVFDGFGGYVRVPSQMALTGDGHPLQVDVGRMTASAFEVLGTLPQRGRLPTLEEDVPGGRRVALLSHGLWVSRYGSDPGVIGRSIELSGIQWQVIGVMPNGYNFPTPEVDVWIPRYLNPESENFGIHSIYGIARLAPGSTIESAVDDAESLIARFGEAGYGPTWFTGVFSGEAFVRTVKEQLVGDARQPLLILLGAIAFLLLIACSNVANLFLVRAEARTSENAVRMALGSGRGRLIRYALTESILLALIGGAAGVLLAYLGTRALVLVGPVSIPRLDEIGIRGSTLLYTGVVSIFIGFFFGLFPALHSGSNKMLGALRDGGRGAMVGGDRHRARSALVVAQVALALVVLVGSGLMVRSYQKLRAVAPGYEAEGLLTFRLAPTRQKYGSPEAVAQFYDEVIGRLEDMPRVTSAGGVTVLPLHGTMTRLPTIIDEFPPTEDEFPPAFLIRRATPGYFETMGIPLVEGRGFTADDHNARLGSMIVSRSLKDRYWPDVSALGKRMSVGVSARSVGAPARSVGVVGDLQATGLEIPAEQYIYLPMLDSVGGGVTAMSMVVRTEADPLSLVPAIRRVIESIDADLPISSIRTMEDVVSDSLSRTSFTMTLLVLAAMIALFLGSVGIYGVISYIVSQRTSEIGVRLALGAGSSQVRWMILKQGMRLAGAGVVGGLLAATAMGQLLTSLLYGVSPFDVPTFAGGSVIFLAVAALAGIVPALRAARIPPAQSLQGS
jgi:putative ABC transport system permease protein